MPKHLLEEEQDTKYGKIIAKQGVRLVYLEDHAKELENKLIQERIDRIEDLQSLKYIARNPDNTNQDILNAIEQYIDAILKIKKEKSFNTNHDT